MGSLLSRSWGWQLPRDRVACKSRKITDPQAGSALIRPSASFYHHENESRHSIGMLVGNASERSPVAAAPCGPGDEEPDAQGHPADGSRTRWRWPEEGSQPAG